MGGCDIDGIEKMENKIFSRRDECPFPLVLIRVGGVVVNLFGCNRLLQRV